MRVFSDMIADELKLPTEARDKMRWSALLHDLGKLTVHPDILNKPGKLSDEEFAVIKAHPIEGDKLAEPLKAWLGPWANSIVEHHEKFDGSGYPYGRSGEEISLGGRIVAVADCYEVITAVRSYKKAASPETARAELARCAGTHFDPEVVRAFLGVSVGRLRMVGGPLAWLAALRSSGTSARLAQTVAALGQAVAVAAVVVVAAAVTAGASPLHHTSATAAVTAATTTTTTRAAATTSTTAVRQHHRATTTTTAPARPTTTTATTAPATTTSTAPATTTTTAAPTTTTTTAPVLPMHVSDVYVFESGSAQPSSQTTAVGGPGPYTFQMVSQPSAGSCSISPGGVVTWTPPSATWTGTTTCSYTVTGRTGTSPPGTMHISVS